MIMMTVILIISELPFFRGYFDHNWPLLGQDSGFITLALAMLILGVCILGDLNTEATSQESLGTSFWQIVLSAGILAMVMSAINLVAVSFLHWMWHRTYTDRSQWNCRALSSLTAVAVSLHAMSGCMEQLHHRKWSSELTANGRFSSA